MYTNKKTFTYFSKRYHKSITVPKGYRSDGATGAIDIESKGWWVHDWLCGNWTGSGPRPPYGRFDDESRCTNWQASMILSDILWDESRYFRAVYWFPFTFLFGGGEARKNGMFKLNKR